MEDIVQIDLKKVLNNKAPKIAKYIPDFLIAAFARFIHQDQMNEILREAAQFKHKDTDMASFTVFKVGAQTETINAKNVPQTGGAVVAANHPLGGIDGLMLISECGKVRKDLKFIVNDILMNVPNFENVFVGVNKHGSSTKAALIEVEKVYQSSQLMVVFPAGLCSRKIDGVVQDLEWHKSFISRSVKYNLPLVPTFIDAQNTPFFYNLARFRKKIGLKINLEMFLLPREMFKQNGKLVKIIFGKPIDPSTFDKRFTNAEWSELLRKYIYQLKTNPDLAFETFIS